MPSFPEGYPTDLLDKILNSCGSFYAYRAYRAADYGLNDPRSFWSTYQEKAHSPAPKIPLNKKRKKPGLNEYSTSFFLTIDKPKEHHDHTMREFSPAVIIRGITCPALGPTRLKEETGHVDWWLYEGAKPNMFFSEVEVNDDAI